MKNTTVNKNAIVENNNDKIKNIVENTNDEMMNVKNKNDEMKDVKNKNDKTKDVVENKNDEMRDVKNKNDEIKDIVKNKNDEMKDVNEKKDIIENEWATYVYWPRDKASYKEEEIEMVIRDMINKMKIRKLEKNINPYRPNKFIHNKCITPNGTKFKVYFDIDDVKTINAFIKNEKETFIYDKSKTNGDNICIFTLENHKKPYLLNLNGRYYSKYYIKSAINDTLKRGKTLRLEDITLNPFELQYIKLYPIYKTNKKIIEYSLNDIECRPRYNPCFSQTLPEITRLFETAEPSCTVHLDTRIIYDKYKDQAMNVYDNKKLKFKDLVIDNIAFPKYAHKIKASYFNIKFINCVIICENFNKQSIYSCLFENCYFIGEPLDIHYKHYGGNYYLNCTFVSTKSLNNNNINKFFYMNGGHERCRWIKINIDIKERSKNKEYYDAIFDHTPHTTIR